MATEGTLSKTMAFLKSNPIIAGLSALMLMAFILPPRKRKCKSRKKGSGRRKGRAGKLAKRNLKNPGLRKKKSGSRPKKSKKSRRQPKASKTRRPRRSSGPRLGARVGTPAHMVKGSKAAKDYMANLRAMRKK